MSDEFMRRFAALVADWLPVKDGETLRQYGQRAQAAALSRSQRAMLAAYMCKVSDELRAEHRARRRVWITAARLSFSAGARRPCVICGRYEGITHAHHTVPLALQFDAGATDPIQDFDWLCPTHHVGIHVFIEALVCRRMESIKGMPPTESDALHRLAVKFVDLFTKLPHWDGVRRR